MLFCTSAQLSGAIESKSVTISERGLTSTQWTEYSEHTKRVQYSTVPTSSITAEVVMVSGFALSRRDTAGVVTSFTRSYTVNGMVLTQTDGRGNNGECDHMGRRATKQVTVGNNVTLHQRYIYRGYLQVASIDLTRSNHPGLWLITWDPTQPVATRPLAIQKDGTWYTYGWNLTKNICEVFGPAGYLRTAYTYTPYGEVSASGDVEQNIQWSSEFNDTELGLIYYNYRHYNPVDGRWMGRDIIFREDELNMYSIVRNASVSHSDELGRQTNQAVCCKRTLPEPQEAIFIYPYQVQGMVLLGFVTVDDVKAFYKALYNLNKIKKDNKRCYYARVYQKGAATISMVHQMQSKCEITYLIGHGIKLDGKDYVEFKDGRICVNDLNIKGKICKGFGCYIGGNSTIVSQSGTLNKLTRELMSLAMSDRCPGFNVCVFSGPVNSRI